MLVSLTIQNVVLIEQLSLTLESGLCALTGETGAGKSILLDALGLALGARSEAGLVRAEAEQAQVSAVFELPASHPSLIILHNSNLFIESGTEGHQAEGHQAEGHQAEGHQRRGLILRRSIGRDGRSRAFINDQPVSVGLLRQVGETLVEIHGQFETQGLLNPATHGALLDDYAGVAGRTETFWRAWQDAQQALADHRAAVESARREEDYLRTSVQDLDSLAPQSGEETHLAARRERLMHRTRVLEALSAADEILSADSDPLRKAAAIVQRVADKAGPEAEQAIAALDRAMEEVTQAQGLLQSLSTDLQEGEGDLESVDERLHELRAQARKHQCAPDDLPRIRDELAGRLNALEAGEDRLADLIRAADQARTAFVKEAQQVHAARLKAGQKLDRLMKAELVPLKLEKAQFMTAVEELPEAEWGPQGISRVRFLVATNPGATPGPLNKIASGGEMARFMLALKVVMAKVGAAPTLIFDEVDTGIGGAVADAVGERLAALGQSHQVLVVTHAPQVAARAAHHYIVRKEGAKALKTNVIVLEDARARREEIARMLSGASITDEARAAADRLLAAGNA
ncbi:MAG: DNA repair protein RecN [Alphaproteobacteria bacterium]|nr:DNA repair protein RecN [Alphaproteobacteria bacterium]